MAHFDGRLADLQDGGRLSSNRGAKRRESSASIFVRCARMCALMGLTDQSRAARKQAYDMAILNFSEKINEAIVTASPRPWQAAVSEAEDLASLGSTEELRKATLQAWWSNVVDRSFERYRDHAIHRPWIKNSQGETIWRPDPIVSTTAQALFWTHQRDKATLVQREIPVLSRQQLVEYPALALLSEVFTPDSNVPIQNELAWHLATWPDENRRDVQFARELAESAVKQLALWPEQPPLTPNTKSFVRKYHISLRPTLGMVLNTLGVAEYRCGDYVKALETLTESNRLNEEREPVDHYFLAMAHARLGDAKQAQQHWDTAQDLVSQPGYAISEEVRGFQAEAEKVLEEAPAQ